MKKITTILFTIIILLACNSTIFGQVPNFSGAWVLNFEKSKLENKTDGLTGQMFIIKQEGDKFSLKIIHFYGD